MSTRGPQEVTSGSNWVTAEHPTPRRVGRTYWNAGSTDAVNCWAVSCLNSLGLPPAGFTFEIHEAAPQPYPGASGTREEKNLRRVVELGCCSVARSCPILRLHELQHARLPCSSLSPGVCLAYCLLSMGSRKDSDTTEQQQMSIESVMTPNHLILCRLLIVPSIFPSIRVFSSYLASGIRWPKYWSFSISPSNE